ncbi:testis- and ovary-specific PAZ domain protein [Wolffia australiana]
MAVVSPVGNGGIVRQRHSQDYRQGDEDSDEDNCSKPPRELLPEQESSWTRVLEDVLWILSAVFVVYLGDWHSNLLRILFFDHRIKRGPLYLGLAGVILNVGLVFFTGLPARTSKKIELPPSSAPAVALAGIFSFSLISFSLWPIWSFLSIPLLITLLMASMAVWAYLPLRPLRLQAFAIHDDQILPV